ncbi:DUF4349 domain-containing protein [Parafrigoribacterium soli]|uniref:DUF4349 domain-containing protein n=1 Tax=Parafrigoribacterium soli TaxID=3144663 RepID=UPI0032EE89FE
MRRLLIPTVIALALLSLAGCTGSGSSSSGAADRAPLTSDAGGAVVGGKVTAPDKRQVITTGDMSITVKDPADAADRASHIVETAGGRIDGRTEHAGDDGGTGSAQVVARIPSAKLNDTVEKLKKLGTARDVSISSSDVTSQAQDLDARISALRTSVDRLQQLMANATSTADLITIESALSERQGNLEAMESQRRQLKDQVDLASVTITLNSPATARAQLPGNFLDGLITGWNSLVSFFAGLVVVVGVLLPWLILGGVIAIAVVALVRWRKRGPSPDAATPDAPNIETPPAP